MANQVEIAGVGYETVAASQTGQIMGTAGAKGDVLTGLVIFPATTSPGAVVIIDGTTSITVFTGGASSVATLAPMEVWLGIKSANGPWSVTTGSAVSAIAVGNFG